MVKHFTIEDAAKYLGITTSRVHHYVWHCSIKVSTRSFSRVRFPTSTAPITRAIRLARMSMRTCRDARSTMIRILAILFFPYIVSNSKSPTRVLCSTTAGPGDDFVRISLPQPTGNIGVLHFGLEVSRRLRGGRDKCAWVSTAQQATGSGASPHLATGSVYL